MVNRNTLFGIFRLLYSVDEQQFMHLRETTDIAQTLNDVLVSELVIHTDCLIHARLTQRTVARYLAFAMPFS